MTAKPSYLSPSRTTCASLLRELQSYDQRDKMLLQLEQECLDIYQKKIEMTRKHRADLHGYLPDGQTQIKAIVSALGEVDERGTLEDQLSALKPVLDELESCSPVTEEYTAQRQESEEDKRKSREQKRLQEQFNAEQEAIFGSRPSTKKPLGQCTSANTMVGTPIVDVHPWAVMESQLERNTEKTEGHITQCPLTMLLFQRTIQFLGETKEHISITIFD